MDTGSAFTQGTFKRDLEINSESERVVKVPVDQVDVSVMFNSFSSKSIVQFTLERLSILP